VFGESRVVNFAYTYGPITVKNPPYSLRRSSVCMYVYMYICIYVYIYINMFSVYMSTRLSDFIELSNQKPDKRRASATVIEVDQQNVGRCLPTTAKEPLSSLQRSSVSMYV